MERRKKDMQESEFRRERKVETVGGREEEGKGGMKRGRK